MNAVGGSASGGRGRRARMWRQLEEDHRM